jgi:DNA modification methylase
MIPYYTDPWLTVYHGDARLVMAEMEPESVHCVVTSPPYWGLRDYGAPGQLGLEPTPEEYVQNMVAVFREVRRVLRSDGTVWLNLGDSYAGSWGNQGRKSERGEQRAINGPMLQSFDGYPQKESNTGAVPPGLKPKDLVGIPWRVAFALQADGWYLRSDIIWSKPNPMPESVTDRPTKAHEYLFLLTKSPRYYYDADAVREAYNPSSLSRYEYAFGGDGYKSPTKNPAARPDGVIEQNPAGRNLRSVWTIATAPYPGAHFATFPPKLVEPCIKAGTSEKGVCPECGAPWVRDVERVVPVDPGKRTNKLAGHEHELSARQRSMAHRSLGGRYQKQLNENPPQTTGWRPSCGHGTVAEAITHTMRTVPATVLDPFAGSGTTGMVAQSLSRRAVLIDLSMDYLGQLMKRNRDMPLGLSS